MTYCLIGKTYSDTLDNITRLFNESHATDIDSLVEHLASDRFNILAGIIKEHTADNQVYFSMVADAVIYQTELTSDPKQFAAWLGGLDAEMMRKGNRKIKLWSDYDKLNERYYFSATF